MLKIADLVKFRSDDWNRKSPYAEYINELGVILDIGTYIDVYLLVRGVTERVYPSRLEPFESENE